MQEVSGTHMAKFESSIGLAL